MYNYHGPKPNKTELKISPSLLEVNNQKYYKVDRSLFILQTN
jgi:hypothetical protein